MAETKTSAVIVRGDEDDFEYVLSNSTMTIQENQE